MYYGGSNTSDSKFYNQKPIINPNLLKTNSYGYFVDQPTTISENTPRSTDKNNIESGEEDDTNIKADLLRADERTKAKEEHFKTPGKLTCYKAKLRAHVITGYGIYGWVDPLKLSSVIGLPVCLVCHGLDHLGYRRYERQGGGIGYTQKAVTA